MTVGWIAFGMLAVGIGWLVTFTLLKIADEQDRAARRAERELIPLSDVTVTRTG